MTCTQTQSVFCIFTLIYTLHWNINNLFFIFKNATITDLHKCSGLWMYNFTAGIIRFANGEFSRLHIWTLLYSTVFHFCTPQLTVNVRAKNQAWNHRKELWDRIARHTSGEESKKIFYCCEKQWLPSEFLNVQAKLASGEEGLQSRW